MRIVLLLLVCCVVYSKQEQNASPAIKYHKAEKVAMIQTVKDLNAIRDAYNKRDYIQVLIKSIDLYDDMGFEGPFLVRAFLKSSRQVLLLMHKVYLMVLSDKSQGKSTDYNSIFSRLKGNNDKEVQSALDKVTEFKGDLTNTFKKFLS